MMRYCTCSRGVGGKITNRTSVVHNYILGVDICSHCGGIVPDDGKDGCKEVRRYDLFKMQAQTCSNNGDHLSAIEFFKKAYDNAWSYHENCDMLSAIAEEYELIGDYVSAEKYWNKCRDVALEFGNDFVYRYIARKGNFFYRIGRYDDASREYKHALNMMNDMNGSFNLSYYARITYYLIDTYDKIGEDNHREKYLHELKQVTDRFSRSGSNDNEIKANHMSQIAWKLYEDERMVDEALILIDKAIELQSGFPSLDYMRKAKILHTSFRYEEALENYDIALVKGKFKKEILKNRA